MKKLIDRGVRVSSGLASFTKKKVKGLAEDLAKEGVLTGPEKAMLFKGVDRVEKMVNDVILKEVKRMYGIAEQGKKKAAKKKSAKRKK